MKSTYNIIWSENAFKGLAEIIAYIENKFSENDVKKFVNLFDEHIEIIKISPKIFPLSHKSKSIRKATVAKLTSIFYSIDGDNIYLLSIFDNRKNPKNLKFK